MLGLGLGEILVISALVLIVVGPERLPQVMRWAGRSYGQLRRAADDLRRAFMLEADRADAEERYRKLMERREESREAHRKARERGAVPQERDLPSEEPTEVTSTRPDPAADGEGGDPSPADPDGGDAPEAGGEGAEPPAAEKEGGDAPDLAGGGAP